MCSVTIRVRASSSGSSDQSPCSDVPPSALPRPNEKLGVQFDSASESLHVRVDFSAADPEFLVWTEERATGDSSGLQRVRQVRAMLERVSKWVEGHAL